ncbi:hypothetical protein CJF42_17870 [Pseudoalteromonas sp. NBT06-2]|nr:hypothetical protein CJF42_17870 [Pseudoalteromonas sp. NBT06-2]
MKFIPKSDAECWFIALMHDFKMEIGLVNRIRQFIFYRKRKWTKRSSTTQIYIPVLLGNTDFRAWVGYKYKA